MKKLSEDALAQKAVEYLERLSEQLDADNYSESNDQARGDINEGFLFEEIFTKPIHEVKGELQRLGLEANAPLPKAVSRIIYPNTVQSDLNEETAPRLEIVKNECKETLGTSQNYTKSRRANIKRRIWKSRSNQGISGKANKPTGSVIDFRPRTDRKQVYTFLIARSSKSKVRRITIHRHFLHSALGLLIIVVALGGYVALRSLYSARQYNGPLVVEGSGEINEAIITKQQLYNLINEVEMLKAKQQANTNNPNPAGKRLLNKESTQINVEPFDNSTKGLDSAVDTNASKVESMEIPGTFKDLAGNLNASTAKRIIDDSKLISTGPAPATPPDIDASKGIYGSSPKESIKTEGVMTDTDMADFHATAYCLRGRTASGELTRPGVIAADPRVLPLGTVVHIRAGSYSGKFPVLDTGARIKGRTIDIYFSSHKEALAFGRKRVKLQVFGHSTGNEITLVAVDPARKLPESDSDNPK